MSKIIAIIFIVSFLFFFMGCTSSKKAVTFLKKCHSAQEYRDNDYFFTTSTNELKENLEKFDGFYYVGSDENFSYLIHYYDKTTKISTGFRIPISELEIENKLDFIENNIYYKKNREYKERQHIKLF